jgi:hypothetical protein
MEDKLERYIRSGHPGIFFVSLEEARIEACLKRLADRLEYRLYAWSLTDGLVDVSAGAVEGGGDPLEAVEAIERLPEKSMVLMRDLHLHLEDGNPVLLRAVKDALARCKTRGQVLMGCGCRNTLPPELEREFVVIGTPLPGRDALAEVLDGICASAGLERPADDSADLILEAAAGLTCAEAENAFALSVVESGAVDPAVVGREKTQAIAGHGLLEICSECGSLDAVGGLEEFKHWLGTRRGAFSRRAAEYGLPAPRGTLILGVPGTGKSLTAKATAAVPICPRPGRSTPAESRDETARARPDCRAPSATLSGQWVAVLRDPASCRGRQSCPASCAACKLKSTCPRVCRRAILFLR